MFTTITTTIEDILNSKKGGNHHYLLKQSELFWCFCFGGTNYDVPNKMKRVGFQKNNEGIQGLAVLCSCSVLTSKELCQKEQGHPHKEWGVSGIQEPELPFLLGIPT